MSEQFQESEIGRRYARALFDLALESSRLDAIERDLGRVKALLAGSADLRRFVASQVYSSDVKGAGIAAVTKSMKLDEAVRKLLGVLSANRRLNELSAVIAAFARLYAEHKGIVTADVVSAAPLSDAQTADLKAALARTLGLEANVVARIDPEILGGLKVRVGSRLFDASLKTKLDSLKFALKKA